MTIRSNFMLMIQGVQTQDFQLSVVFESNISDFTLSNIDVSGGGGEISSISPIPNDTTASSNWVLNISVFEDIFDSLVISVIGSVTQNGETLNLEHNDITIQINTLPEPTSTQIDGPATAQQQGSLVYKNDGIIELPISLSTNAVFDRADLLVTFSGNSSDAVKFYEEFNYYVVGESTSYKAIFESPTDSSGSFTVQTIGTALSTTGNEIAIPSIMQTINYDTTIPYLTDIDMEQPIPIAPAIYDIYMSFNVFVTDLAIDDFIQDGVDLSAPVIYRWGGTGDYSIAPKEYEVDLNQNDDGEYTNYSTGNLKDEYSSWSKSNISGNTVAAKHFLLRFVIPTNLAAGSGSYNILLKEGAVRGPSGQSN